MDNLFLIAVGYNDMWYAIPLIIVVSLVYAATRHEDALAILHHAARIGTWIVGFMAVIFVVLLLILWWL